MEENKQIRIEPEAKAPDRIRKKVQGTLDTYRMAGEVANLYISQFMQAFITLTDMAKPNEFTEGHPRPYEDKDKNK